MICIPKKEISVSVIIPTYNSSGTLRLAIQSILWQDFNDFDVWIVGDGCTDDSESVVTSFMDYRLHWLNLPDNSGGPSIPRNEGLRRAKGRFIAYLGHDDLWFPWHLSELIDCIETSNSDFVYSLGAALGPKGVIGTFSLSHQPILNPLIPFSPSNWFHRKSLIEIIGAWSPYVKYGDDREFLNRVLKANIALEFRKRLSVLKFPSEEWQMYSLKEKIPQTRYAKSISEDAEELRDELLLEIATLMSRKEFLQKKQNSVYKYFRNFAARAIILYGIHRWPMNKLLNQRYRRRAGLG